MKKRAKDLITTGIAGLDQIFYGGIKQHNIVLVEGGPGTGKTTLGIEFIYRGAKEQKENGLILSFELSPEKLMHDMQSFGWEFEGLVRKGRVKIITPAPQEVFEGLDSPQSEFIKEIQASGIRRVLIDGLTPLQLASEISGGRTFREGLCLLIDILRKHNVTAILTRELADGRTTTSPIDHEQFLCDTIISLSNISKDRSMHRCLEVKKSRGQDFVPGKHTLKIIPGEGLHVFQRTQTRPRIFMNQPTSSVKLSTGNKNLDQIMGGGIYEGSVTLSVGITGTGKTVLATQFLCEGARTDQPCLFVTVDEHPKQLIRNATSMGLDFEKYIDEEKIHIFYDSPLELEMDVHFEKIVRYVEKYKIKRVVIDSVATYESINPREVHEFVFSLATYFKNYLITAFFNYESPELLGLSQISHDLRASAVADNIVLLNYVEISTQMRRAITVPKVRGAKIPQQTHEFVIEEGGIRLLDDTRDFKGDVDMVPQLPFSAYYGVLSRAPARKSPAIEESIAAGEGVPESSPLN